MQGNYKTGSRKKTMTYDYILMNPPYNVVIIIMYVYILVFITHSLVQLNIYIYIGDIK